MALTSKFPSKNEFAELSNAFFPIFVPNRIPIIKICLWDMSVGHVCADSPVSEILSSNHLGSAARLRGGRRGEEGRKKKTHFREREGGKKHTPEGRRVGGGANQCTIRRGERGRNNNKKNIPISGCKNKDPEGKAKKITHTHTEWCNRTCTHRKVAKKTRTEREAKKNTHVPKGSKKNSHTRTEAETDLGQTDFGQKILTDFGQF